MNQIGQLTPPPIIAAGYVCRKLLEKHKLVFVGSCCSVLRALLFIYTVNLADLDGLIVRGLQLLGCDEIGKNEIQKLLAPFPRSASFISVSRGPGKASLLFVTHYLQAPSLHTRYYIARRNWRECE